MSIYTYTHFIYSGPKRLWQHNRLDGLRESGKGRARDSAVFFDQ